MMNRFESVLRGVAALSARARRRQPTHRVVDAPTRLLHALMALTCLGAYVSGEAERWRGLHITLGYTLGGLLLVLSLLGRRNLAAPMFTGRAAGARTAVQAHHPEHTAQRHLRHHHRAHDD